MNSPIKYVQLNNLRFNGDVAPLYPYTPEEKDEIYPGLGKLNWPVDAIFQRSTRTVFAPLDTTVPYIVHSAPVGTIAYSLDTKEWGVVDLYTPGSAYTLWCRSVRGNDQDGDYPMLLVRELAEAEYFAGLYPHCAVYAYLSRNNLKDAVRRIALFNNVIDGETVLIVPIGSKAVHDVVDLAPDGDTAIIVPIGTKAVPDVEVDGVKVSIRGVPHA